MKYLSALLSGWLFALGLGLSGMTHPAKIIAFLDIFGLWDPSLLFVMGGAVTLTFLLFPLVLARPQPVLNGSFHVSGKRPADARLVLGASLFGIGWGISGYCPGPALVSLASLNRDVIVFVIFLVLGLGLGRRTCR